MKLIYIENKKAELKGALDQCNVHEAVAIAKDLGLSQRNLCKLASIDMGNFNNFLNGKLVRYNQDHVTKIFTVLEKIFF